MLVSKELYAERANKEMKLTKGTQFLLEDHNLFKDGPTSAWSGVVENSDEFSDGDDGDDSSVESEQENYYVGEVSITSSPMKWPRSDATEWDSAGDDDV